MIRVADVYKVVAESPIPILTKDVKAIVDDFQPNSCYRVYWALSSLARQGVILRTERPVYFKREGCRGTARCIAWVSIPGENYQRKTYTSTGQQARAYADRIKAGKCREANCEFPPQQGYVRCSMHVIIHRVQCTERRRIMSGKPQTVGDLLELDHAKLMLLGGKTFGDVYPLTHPDDRLELKRFFVETSTLPAHLPQNSDAVLSPTESIVSARDMGYTGDVCQKCGGCRMKRSGYCQVCSDCGEQGGCG